MVDAQYSLRRIMSELKKHFIFTRKNRFCKVMYHKNSLEQIKRCIIIFLYFPVFPIFSIPYLQYDGIVLSLIKALTSLTDSFNQKLLPGYTALKHFVLVCDFALRGITGTGCWDSGTV